MTMTAGTVTVASDGTASGGDLARALYDADVATMTLPDLPVVGSTAAPYTAARPATQDDVDLAQAGRLRALQEAARRANAYASALVTYLKANARARVTSESLGRTPSPNDPNTGIQPPVSPVDIPLV
ncbi:hypothetical protein [Sorangium sp. So ce233]|uniref:hypothetical protein n=1 Tax=Sorangium sp. So ce233 TaxID=3133290 RepID=UPI003F611199